MELSEAKELLKEMKESAMYLRLYHDNKAQLKVDAIDTILKALDNSISKDELRKLLSVMETDEEIAMSNEDEKIVNELQYLKGKLQELLGEE